MEGRTMANVVRESRHAKECTQKRDKVAAFPLTIQDLLCGIELEQYNI